VTGTNGKTTTARMLYSIARAAGLQPIANRAGSNLMRGIAAALVEAADPLGRLSSRERRLGIFEVDEATMPEAAAALGPRAVAFTNLFRDQLDRYGEVEHVAYVWREAAEALLSETTLVLNADDPAVSALAGTARGRTVFFGLGDPACGVGRLEHAADARWCTGCRAELRYDVVYYGHLGRWGCPRCGQTRPPAAVEAIRVEAGADGLHLTIALSADGDVSLHLPLMGLIGLRSVQEGLASFTAAFGRQESLDIDGRRVQVILAKNPAGLNQVLRALIADGAAKDLAFFLNDNIADGRDVSWIWDVDFELLAGRVRSLVVSGTRAWDMALRLKYGGVASDPAVETDTPKALRHALQATPEGGTLYVVPTYTAMLTVREILARWGQRPHFWEET
jgi:UDP-N-acetylmuramyl tripeptide synthase